MIILLGVLAGVASVPLTGGSLRHLDFFAFHRSIWLALAVLLQVGMFQLPDGVLPRLMHVASFVAAGVFLSANLELRGVVWARRGGALNLVAIVLNLGVMPARPEAWHASGLGVPPSHAFLNARPTESVLVWIGDCIPMPSWLPGAAPFSIGDALIAIAITVVLRHACGSSGRFLPALRRRGEPDDTWWWHLDGRSVLEQSNIDRSRVSGRGRSN